MLEVPEASGSRWPDGPGTPTPQVRQGHDDPYLCPQPKARGRAPPRRPALKETIRCVIQKPSNHCSPQ